MRCIALLWCCVALAGCDDSGPASDPDPEDAGATLDARGAEDVGVDGAAGGDATPLDGALGDAAVLDASPRDGSPPDAQVVDAAMDRGAMDAEPPDAAIVDATVDAQPDAVMPDAVAPDSGQVDAGPLGGFVIGEARAADAAARVTISVGEIRTQSDADGRFRLGPLPAGPVTLTLGAPRHQQLTREVEVVIGDDVALPDPVLLYRGRRVGPAAGSQLRFSFDGAWLIWSEDDALWTRRTGPDAQPVELLARGFEVFLGFVPGQDAIAARRRVEVGLAGDIDVITLADGARQPLFAEAQPWVRWRGDAALGMVGTRDGLSQLVLNRPGDMARTLGEGVPWLLVTELVDGEPAWVQRAGDAFAVWRGGDAVAAEPLAPGFPSSDQFLTTTPGRTGLLWLGPAGDLIRWEPDAGPARLAEDVLASPRPRFVPQGLLFWRADPAEPGLQRLFLLADGGERQIIDAVDSATFRLSGDRYYVVRPEDGLWNGTLAGAPARLLAGERFVFTTQGPGVIALVDGAAWWAIPGGARVDLGVDGLTTLQGLAVGATAWQAASGTLWWIAGPDQAAPAMPIVRDAPRARRTVEPGNAAVFALGPDGYLRAPIPPGMPQTMFAEVVTELSVLSAQQVLGWQPDDWLYAIDPQTGAATGWAASVSRIVSSSDRRFVAYVSDRGTFLVDREE